VLSQSFEPPPVRYIWAGGKCSDPKIHQWKLVDYCFLSLCVERWRKKRKHSSSASFPAFLPSWRCNKAATAAAQQHPYLSARLALLLLLLPPMLSHSLAQMQRRVLLGKYCARAFVSPPFSLRSSAFNGFLYLTHKST
jgi:hypothetical protein